MKAKRNVLRCQRGLAAAIRRAMLGRRGRFTTWEVWQRFHATRELVCLVARAMVRRGELRHVAGRGHNGSPRVYEVAR